MFYIYFWVLILVFEHYDYHLRKKINHLDSKNHEYISGIHNIKYSFQITLGILLY